jgi:glycosyltransferase involved in cell wall biosynthesis
LVFISVIIISDLRKRFLKRAVESVLSQELDRDLFELIVVKRFEDKSLDTFLKVCGVRVLRCDEERIGPKYYMGLQAAKGEVIAFLEDDDAWLPGKLARIYSVFSRFDKVCFYHNSIMPVDEQMHVVAGTMLDAQLEAAKKFSANILPASSLSFRDIEKLYESGAAFNMSSMCIRKNCFLKHSKLFRDIDLLPDPILFMLSLANNGLIFLDNEQLTMYGVHFDEHRISSEENSNYYSLREGKTLYIEDKMGRIPKYLKDLDKIANFLNDPRLKRSLDCRKEELRIISLIVNRGKRLDIMKILIRYFRTVMSGLTKRTAKYIAVAISYLVMPSFTRYFYMFLSNRHYITVSQPLP